MHHGSRSGVDRVPKASPDIRALRATATRQLLSQMSGIRTQLSYEAELSSDAALTIKLSSSTGGSFGPPGASSFSRADLA